MVSTGVNTNASQFYISLGPMKQLNGRCVVFGRMIEGEDVLETIEKVKSMCNNVMIIHLFNDWIKVIDVSMMMRKLYY